MLAYYHDLFLVTATNDITTIKVFLTIAAATRRHFLPFCIVNYHNGNNTKTNDLWLYSFRKNIKFSVNPIKRLVK